jgi:hypothetical protein
VAFLWPSPIANLPDLKPAARARIHTVHEHAAQLLVQDIGAAWQSFYKLDERPGSRTVAVIDRLNALHSAHHNAVTAGVKALLQIFDAIAAEYYVVDTDEQEFLDRIHSVIIPAVCDSILLPNPESTVSTAILARAAHWERFVSQPDRPARERRRPGRPAKFPEERKQQALDLKLNGGTNSECAKLLYQTKHPTAQQVRNIPAILKNYRKRSGLGH